MTDHAAQIDDPTCAFIRARDLRGKAGLRIGAAGRRHLRARRSAPHPSGRRQLSRITQACALLAQGQWPLGDVP